MPRWRVVKVWVAHPEALQLMGRLPDGVDVEVWDGRPPVPDSRHVVEFYVPPFLARGAAVEVLRDMPRLRVVQLLTAGAEAVLPHVPAGVTVCNARGAHDPATAEWIVAAIVAVLRSFPRFVRAQQRHQWDYAFTDVLAGRTVLIVGYGSIGAAVERRLAGFDVSVLRVARRPRDGVSGVSDLPTLLPQADVVVLLVPLTGETRGMVDTAFLARMHDGALLVNAARGPVVDTDALLAELDRGRLLAALDVTDPEPLPSGHPLWDAPGLFLTPHVAGSTPLSLPRAYAVVGAQVRRYVAGEPLANVVSAY